MTKRKLFVCLTAFLLVSVLAVSVSAALNDKAVLVEPFDTFRARSGQSADNRNLALTVSSVVKNPVGAHFQVSGYTTDGDTRDELSCYESPSGVIEFRQNFPLYFSIIYYPTELHTKHFLLDDDYYAYAGIYDLTAFVTVP